MHQSPDNPRVYVPPPLIYAAVFLLSFPVRKYLPFDNSFFYTLSSKIIGVVMVAASLFFLVPALAQFLRTKNTVITVKPATSLQTRGVYSMSRNPMYLGLLLVYAGLGFLVGGWWTLILLVPLVMIITRFIIIPEEKYLGRAFGQSFLDYKNKVRRWL